MREPHTIDTILNQVGTCLLDKGDGYSVGQLVAEYIGDGSTHETDPYNVFDRHFYDDIKQVNEWPDDPRDPDEVETLLDTFESYWKANDQLRFCQIICNAHIDQHGLGAFDPNSDGSAYKQPLDTLTDDELLAYLEKRNENE